ncbi:MAG: hypothetical protein Q7S11_04430 [bacterium]|nr:hypothetical protein [bacterium]
MFKKFIFTATFIMSALPGFFLVKAMYGSAEQPLSAPVKDAVMTRKIIEPPTTAVKETASNEPAQKNALREVAKTVKTTLDTSLTKTLSPASANDETLHNNDNQNNQEKNQSAQVVSVIQKPNPTTSPFIFLDELLSGWTIETSSAHADIKSPRNGAYAIQMIFNDAQGEVRFKNDTGVDIKAYDGIDVHIAGNIGDEEINLILYDAKGNKLGSQNISRYLYAGKITKDYAQMYISFIPFKASGTVVSQIVFQSQKPEEIYIDNLIFTGQPTHRPTSGLGDTYAPDVFTDKFQNGWDMPTVNADTRIYHKDGLSDSPSIQTTFREAGESVLFRQEQGMHTYSYHYLTFWAKGQALQDTIYVQTKNTTETELNKITLGDYVKNIGDYDNFQKISIPLSRLGAENSIINDIIFSSRDASQGLYLDNISFEP